MPRFNKGKNSGNRNFGGGRDSGRGFGGGRDRERPDMHRAICDECGESCEVPFRPSGDKPIYCSDCFRDKRGDDSRGRGEGRRDRQSSGGRDQKQMYAAICGGCGENCEVPFRPSGDKPVYCGQCFDKNKSGAPLGTGGKSGGDGQMKSQLDALNAKLDKILKILAPDMVEDTPKAPKAKKEKDLKKESDEEAKEIAAIIEEMKAMEVEGASDEPKKEKKPVAKKSVAKKETTKKAPAKKAAAKKK